MKKTNTLFSYFNKSPKPNGSSPAAPTPDKENIKKTAGSSVKRTKLDAKVESKRQKTPSKDSSSLNVGELVWAKLEGHPWWPSLVCKHPTSGQHYKKESGKSKTSSAEIHVHFFGDPPSRAWVKEKFVKPFDSNRDIIAKNGSSKLQKAIKDAEEASKRSIDDRLSGVCDASSDGDNENESLEELDEDVETPQKRKAKSTKSSQKRRRIVILSEEEDSEDEFKPKSDDDTDSDSGSDDLVAEESNLSAGESDSDTESRKKKRIKKDVKGRTKSSTPVMKTSKDLNISSNSSFSSEVKSPSCVGEKTKAKLSLFAASESSFSTKDSGSSDGKIWTHLTLDFLKEGQRRDLKGRRESHPEYDPKTLLIPDRFKTSLSPAMRQWWELKSHHFDVVLFFKVGKFYEFYHMDAVIGVNELNLVFMKGDYAHSGFPEIAYGRYSASLIEKGYRVARVEQTENPAMMEERCKKIKNVTKYDKVVKREICQITTKGTRRYGFLDGQTNESNPAYLLAVTEREVDGESEFGVCFIDTSIGKFHLGQFHDDRHCSRFRTLIAHFAPVQVLYERGSVSAKSMQILKNCLCEAIVDPLFPQTEFWGSEKTLKYLAEGGYFNKEENPKNTIVWPIVLQKMLSESDCRGLTAKTEYELAVRSLGAITWYLSDSFLDQELLTMKSFEMYTPVDKGLPTESINSVAKFFRSRRNMVLDGITLKNLDILQNNSTGTLEGTLLVRLDHCSTLAGKRLIRQWICTPLCDPSFIEERLDAISDLLKHSDVAKECNTLLKKLPDLERLLSKIHTQGSALRSRCHPDSRAMFYDDNIYSKRKILDFLSVLRGFKTATEIVALFKRSPLQSKLLKRCVTIGGDGMFPNLKKLLIFFDEAFDHEQAKKDGKIVPSRGVDSDYDNAVDTIKETKRKLDAYLEKQCRHLDCKVTYVGTARNRFQIEVPERVVKRVPDKYELQGQRKGFKRYWTAEVKELLSETMSAEDLRDAALRDIMRRIFATFAKDYENWDRAVQCLATLDVLLSLAHYSEGGSSTMCRPTVVLPSDSMQPFIEISNGVHPCISTVFSGGDFIPNDTAIGVSKDGTNASLVLVTGPNMGGKSTLMRQVGLIVIIAQMGCYVPAETCRLTPVDRVFTRLGASDRIMHGESTFMVELSETSSILQHATPHSLVLMDELGRGTSTYDGIAIAHSVVNELAHSIRCRTFFSTHYHSLVDQFSADSSCKLGHMACLVENENEDDPTQETITFLYKFMPGACPKSYGFNAAKLAGIPNDVVKNGHKKAKELENITEAIRIFGALNQATDLTNEKLVQLISSITLN